MIEKICDMLMKRIRKKMPEVDDERAEVIKYGLEIIIGEIPKMILLIAISLIFGIFKYTMIALIVVFPYRYFAGGIHLKTHLGCILGTSAFYFGNVYISKLLNNYNINTEPILLIIGIIFSIIMISLYAPADTENIPILRKKDRLKKKICSYISVVGIAVVSIIAKDKVVSNICVIGMIFQSLAISKIAYDFFKIKLGYLEYVKEKNSAIQ